MAILPHELDYLHFGFATPAIDRELVGKAIGAQVSVSFRGFDINQVGMLNKDVFNHFWQHVDKVHSISEDLYRSAVSMGLPVEVPFEIIPPAINIDLFPFKKEPFITQKECHH